MSGVTQIKLEIKPTGKKTGSSNKSIPQVANTPLKQESLKTVTNSSLSTTNVKTVTNSSLSAGNVKVVPSAKSSNNSLKAGNSKSTGLSVSVQKFDSKQSLSDRNGGKIKTENVSVSSDKRNSLKEGSKEIKLADGAQNKSNVSTVDHSDEKREGKIVVSEKRNISSKQLARNNTTADNSGATKIDVNIKPTNVSNTLDKSKLSGVSLNNDNNVSRSVVDKKQVENVHHGSAASVGKTTRKNEIVKNNDTQAGPITGQNQTNLNIIRNQLQSSDSSSIKKPPEQKNIKMFSQGMKDELLKKRNDMLAGPKTETMDQEKHVDLGEEPPDFDNTIEDKIVPAPANMIDELQKYLLKRFGPVEPIKVQDNVNTTQIVNNENVNENSEKIDSSNVKDTGNSDKTGAPTSPRSPETFIPHPIFFKTSIKSDPGSKLHDQLLKELGSVLKKKSNKSDDNMQNTDNDKEKEEGRDSSKIPKRRVSAKGNKILGNKLLLANLENQLQRTLHRNKIFQRQKLKVVDLETIEVTENDSSSQNDVTKVTSPKNIETTKNDAKLIFDFKNYHEGDDNVLSAMNELDKTIDAHSDYTSQSPSNNIGNSSPRKLNDNSKDVVESRGTSEVSTSNSGNSDITSKGNDIIVVRDTDNDENKSLSDESDDLYVVAFKTPSGQTEGVVCSVERRESTRDSRGRPRKYLTCINIVAEKATDISEEGCPFTQDIADGGLPTASGQGLFFGEEDKPTQFNVDVGRRKGDLRVSVSGPNSIAKCSVDPQDDGSYTVTYVPVETGLFDIRVTWNDTDIPGSPYHPKVVDARKVRIIGGWQHFYDSNERVNLVVNETKQLPFDVSEAGPGTFRAEVQGPSYSIDSTIDNHTSGRVVVEFVPKEEGTHYIHLFWSDIPLVNSPFLGFAVQHTPDASKLILTGRGLKEAVVREEAEFVIDGSQAGRGNPDVVLSGVRAEVNVNVSPIGNGRFRCTYVPILPGAYLLHITWNGRQLRGSPYKVNVIGAFYPNRVVVSGVGGAILGREMNVGIDTRKAGPGELTAYCMGPHQVAYCELEDNHDGTFRLAVKAQESGRHVLQIKYGGEHVQGSPFIYKVTAQPDASKVRVHGPGVEHGILATYISRFIVETRGAGAGQLTVRIRGPKGAFQVEMYRDSQRDRTILCKFDPTECGLYIISVKWSGVDVPGSPFHVHILDTQEELEQVLNEVSYSIGTSHSHHGGSSRISHHGGGSSHISHATPRMVYGQWRDQI